MPTDPAVTCARQTEVPGGGDRGLAARPARARTDVSGSTTSSSSRLASKALAVARGVTKEKLTEPGGFNREWSEAFPGVVFNFRSTSRTTEKPSRSEGGRTRVKVSATDLESNEKIAEHIVEVMVQVSRHRRPRSFTVLGQPTAKIIPSREVALAMA